MSSADLVRSNRKVGLIRIRDGQYNLEPFLANLAEYQPTDREDRRAISRLVRAIPSALEAASPASRLR